MVQAIKGCRYKHKKGGRYEVLELGKHTETNEEVVVYKSLDYGTVHIRPKTMFEDEGRFELLEEGDRDVLLRVASELDFLGGDLTNEELGELSNIREQLFAMGRTGRKGE